MIKELSFFRVIAFTLSLTICQISVGAAAEDELRTQKAAMTVNDAAEADAASDAPAMVEPIPVLFEDKRYLRNQCAAAGQTECSVVDDEIYLGAAPADRATFFNSVGLEIRFDAAPDSFVCSGTLIAPTLILTARHCIEPDSTSVKASTIFGAFGAHINPAKDPDVIRVEVRDCFDFGQRTPKPCAQLESTRPTDRDIVVMRLVKAAPTFPAQLADPAWIDRATSLVAVGYGLTEEKGPNNLREIGRKLFVEVPVASNSCDGKVGKVSDADKYDCVPGVELVAGRGSYHRRAAADTCGGDSGGTMYLIRTPPGATRNPVWPYDYYLAAATSRAIPAPQAKWPYCGDGGVYVRMNADVASWLAGLATDEGASILR